MLTTASQDCSRSGGRRRYEVLSRSAVSPRASSERCLCWFFFSSRRRHTRFDCDWSSDVCSSDLGHRRTTSRRIRRSLEREADDDHQRPDPSGTDSGLGFCYSTGTNIRTVLPGEHGIELLWPVAVRNVAHTSPSERTDVSECADVSGVLHDAYHRPGGGGFAGVLALVP